MKKTLIPIVLLLCSSTMAQTPNGTLDFGNTTDATTATTGNTGFGGVRVGSGGGGFVMRNAGQEIGVLGELEGTAPTGASINSVGVTSTEYGTSSTTFTITFDMYLSGGASGIWYFFAGNVNGGAANGFGANQSTGFAGTQVFTGLRMAFGGSDAITTANRAGSAWVNAASTPFAQNTAYTITIVGNNSASTVNYGTGQSVLANTYDLWVNGTLVENDLDKALLPSTTNINAFRFYGESSAGNVAKINLDNIKWWNSCVAPSVSVYTTLTSIPAGTYTDVTVNSANATLAGGISVNRELIVRDNLTLTTGGNLTLRSTANGTARVEVMNGTANITGNVIMERFIPANANRAWRLLSVPTTGTQTIAQTWQLGTWLTNTTGTNGFDAQTSGNSMLYFDGTATLQPITNTANRLDARSSYFLFVRGDRTSTNNNATVTTATLSSIGTINQGNITTGVAGTGAVNFSLIPNPYPSNIDFEAVYAGNGSSISSFYVWDASLNTVGGYRTITRTPGPTYTMTPGGEDATARYIQSGQAFWIPSQQQLNFTESMKVSNNPTSNAFRPSAGNEQLSIELHIKQTAGNYMLADGVRASYDNAYNAAVNTEDVAKLSNFTENLAITRSGNDMAIERRPIISANDTIFLKLWNTTVKDYRFKVTPMNFTAGLDAYLEDAFLNTSTPLSLIAATEIDFSVTTDVASKATDRFRIVFRPSSVMPVNFTAIRAYEKENVIEVAWNVAGENDIHHYEVEKSVDGRNFSLMASVKATGNENGTVNYTSLDIAPVNGNNFYRVKSVSLAGEMKYSAIVNVNSGGGKDAVSVYPNPVIGNKAGVQLTNLEKGIYTVNIYSINGQLIVTKMLQHNGGSASEQIEFPSVATKGIYRLEVKGEKNRYVQTIILQ